MQPISIDTERLRLRQWRASDRQPFTDMNADPRVMEFFPETLKPAESDQMAERAAALIEDRGWGFWAVERLGHGDFIGFVGLNEPRLDLPFAPCVEVGWRLAAAHWGHGFATEAARAAVRVGFESLGIDEIVAFTPVGNHRSRNVMKKLGMAQDEATFDYPGMPICHPLRRHCLYRLARAAWRVCRSQGAE